MRKPTAAIVTDDAILRHALQELLEDHGFAVTCDHDAATGAAYLIVHKDPWPRGWNLGRLRELPSSIRCLLLGSSPTDGPFLTVGLANSTFVPLPSPTGQLVEQLRWSPVRG